MTYRKVWWSGRAGQTAGLVFDNNQLTEILSRPNGFVDLSRAWPMTEAMKMTRLYISAEYKTWNEAFAAPREEKT